MNTALSKINELVLSSDGDGWSLRRLVPRTMTGMVAAGCLLAAVPLLAALILAGVALEQLSQHAERLVEEGLSITRLGGYLQDDIYNLERNARQYAALGDDQLLPVISARLRDANDTLLRIGSHSGLREPFVNHVARLRQGLTEAESAWAEGLRSSNLEAALERIHSLGPEAAAISQAGGEAVDAEVSELRQAAHSARRVMTWSGLALIPLAGLLGLAFSVAVTRPLKRLGQAIAVMGRAQYGKPVAIGYPREMQRLGQQLDWLRRRLAQLESDKDRFLRHVSHELKTPLASLYEGAELLREGSLGPLTERQKEVAQIMAEAAAELSALIGNLLAYAEWREERRRVEIAWFDARALVEEVLSAQALAMARRGVTAELEIAGPRLNGHRSQLRAALGNLVANAIKHAPAQSSIVVRTALDGGYCELSVRDAGPGVPEHEKQKIFEPFVRGAEDEAGGVRGTGIGLSIVREAMAAHGGTVAVEDAQPGACFRLRWPAENVDGAGGA